MTRTDEHRPSAIEPANYEFVGFECIRVDGIGDAQVLLANRQRIRAHMEKTGGTYSGHEHGGNCHICGSVNAIYTALFHHASSNSYIRTGLDCAEKLGCENAAMFRKRVTEAREAVAGKRKAEVVLSDAGLSAAWAIFKNWQDAIDAQKGAAEVVGVQLPREESTVVSIVGNLVRYGSLSVAQISYVRKLVDQITNRAQIEAARKAEAESALPVPAFDGRVTVTGKVLSTRVDDFGIKMLVQHADGWKLWGTLPSTLHGIERGATVEFKAAVKRSDRDPKFGFFSRPTMAKVAA